MEYICPHCGSRQTASELQIPSIKGGIFRRPCSLCGVQSYLRVCATPFVERVANTPEELL